MNDVTEQQLVEDKRSAEKMAKKAIEVLKKRAPADPEAAQILENKGVTEDHGS
jgi:hypothetical protein